VIRGTVNPVRTSAVCQSAEIPDLDDLEILSCREGSLRRQLVAAIFFSSSANEPVGIAGIDHLASSGNPLEDEESRPNRP